MDDNLKEILLKSGWKEKRKIFTLDYQLYARMSGYYWNKVIRDFLREFGDLEILFERNCGQDLLHFDVHKAIRGIDPRVVLEEYNKAANTKNLCVIGQAYTTHLTLLMSETGEVFGGYDESFCLLGNTGIEAIENICFNKPSLKEWDLDFS